MSSARMNITLVRVSGPSPLLDACAAIYAQTWGRSARDARWSFAEYTQLPHFQAVVARTDSHEVGFALGAQSCPGQWWHDSVAEQVGGQHPALQHAFVLIELAVLPVYRSLGIGGLLHNVLLERQPMTGALLSTMTSNVDGLRFYHRLGWQTLHPGFVFYPGQEAYTILSKQVPTP